MENFFYINQLLVPILIYGLEFGSDFGAMFVDHFFNADYHCSIMFCDWYLVLVEKGCILKNLNHKSSLAIQNR